MIKINWSALILCCCCSILSGTVSAAQTLHLAGNKVASYIDDHHQPSRQLDIVSALFSNAQSLEDIELTLSATTQAWLGSGLRSGKFNGYIDHYSLNDAKSGYVYSQGYLQFDLYVVSKSSSVQKIARLDQLAGERVGIENRFANTDLVRSERVVSWARTPSFYDNIKQLAQDRVDYILVDKSMIDEFNKMLLAIEQEPVYFSAQPMYQVDVSIGISSATANAKNIVKQINSSIGQLANTEKLKVLVSGEHIKVDDKDPSSPSRLSLLDDAVYADILRKW